MQVVATNKAATILEMKTRRHRCKIDRTAKSTLHLGTVMEAANKEGKYRDSKLKDSYISSTMYYGLPREDWYDTKYHINWMKIKHSKKPPTETKVMVKDASQTWYNL